MTTFRSVNPIETPENLLLRRSSERYRLQHETRQQAVPYVIRYPRRQSSRQSEFSNNESTSRYCEYNSNPQRRAYGRSSHHDYSYHNFSPPLNRNHLGTFWPNNRAEARSVRANISLNRNVMPPPNRVQNSAARHDDRYWRHPSSTRSRSSQNSDSAEYRNASLISDTIENVSWVPNRFTQVGNVNRIAPSSTRSQSVNWIEPFSTHFGTGTSSWIIPSSSRSESVNPTASSYTQLGNWTSPISSQHESINRTYSTHLESSQTSASQTFNEHRRNENHESQQDEDTFVHSIEDRNLTAEIAEPRNRKSEKKPNKETVSSAISCPVCLCNYDEISNSGKHFVSGKCGHIICNVCINILLNRRKNCPRCRCSLYRRDIWRLYL